MTDTYTTNFGLVMLVNTDQPPLVIQIPSLNYFKNRYVTYVKTGGPSNPYQAYGTFVIHSISK